MQENVKCSPCSPYLSKIQVDKCEHGPFKKLSSFHPFS